MYIGKMNDTQIKEMLRTMMVQEARKVSYYQNNLPQIMDNSIFKYMVVKSRYGEYVVSMVENGDLFVFDDCNYVKFETPNYFPSSLQKNTNIYNNFMRSRFTDYYKYEEGYENNTENIVNFVKFCDDVLKKYKKDCEKTQFTNKMMSTPAVEKER